ncbi:PREDICTED: uncharacterized protein LOC105458160, partial [Wasmannia auropunctata]|uniref:uncharacterized protein LOC105458160 n=1 Tax=Wasmannia auropunctata TaxID=64793 RepID=UPI0005EF47C6
MDADGLLRAQTELQGRIARACENLKKQGSAKITVGALESRLQSLEANWKKFEENHEVLRTTHWETVSKHDYFEQNFYDLAEEKYLQQSGAFRDALISLRKPGEGTGSSLPTMVVGEHKGSRTLPRINLPQFSGVYDEWPSFRNLFKSLVDRDATLTNIEKLHYLKTSVRGDAEHVIRNLLITSENYERAWAALAARYENKRLLTQTCLSTVTSLPRMKTESAQELRRVFNTMVDTYDALE